MAFQRVCETFKIVQLNAHQREAKAYFVDNKKDVFINLTKESKMVEVTLEKVYYGELKFTIVM